MSNPDGEVTITRAKRLRIPRVLDSGRVAKLRAFKGRVREWAEPSPTVYNEPIIVCIKAREIERCWDHFYSDVIRFEDLLSQKKLASYAVKARDAVIAYLLVFSRGSRHLITGFISTFPEFSTITAGTVGQALSRLKAEGWTSGRGFVPLKSGMMDHIKSFFEVVVRCPVHKKNVYIRVEAPNGVAAGAKVVDMVIDCPWGRVDTLGHKFTVLREYVGDVVPLPWMPSAIVSSAPGFTPLTPVPPTPIETLYYIATGLQERQLQKAKWWLK